MDLEYLLKTNSNILSYKILNNTICYSSIDKPDDSKTNDSVLWGKLFNLSYQKIDGETDAVRSTKVWKNSYDGSDISKTEMDEWLSTTIKRIKELIGENCKVLEVGSGNGLIFNSIINDVFKYTGTDVAEIGLKLIANSKEGQQYKDKIELFQLDALNIDKIPADKYDLVIINSVAQYFPSLDYFLKFLKKLEPYCSNNCHIFIGDVRSLELQKLFYFDIIKTKYPNLSKKEMFEKLGKLKLKENETFYHTKLFQMLPSIFGYISSSCIELKNGVEDNELNNYRYNVTLQCNSEDSTPSISSVKWESLASPLNDIKNRLSTIENDSIIAFTSIPNDRYFNIKKHFKSGESTDGEMNLCHSKSDVTISDLKKIANQSNLQVQTCFTPNDIFSFDVQFCKSLSFNKMKENLTVGYTKLCNRLNEKKTKEDQNMENKILEKFPNYTLIKVSSLLFQPTN